MGIKSIYSIDEHYLTSATSEELLQEWSTDLSTFSDETLEVELTALIKATGAAATFRVRIGGTIGLPDGALAAQIATSDTSYVQAKGALGVLNPGTLTLVKLTGVVSDGAGSGEMRGSVVVIRGATVVAPPAPPISGRMPPGDFDDLWGRDIHFDVAAARGGDYVVTAKGDWLIVSGRECLRQSLLREFLTEPGEWVTAPTYGAGARGFVKARNRKTERDQLANRLRACAVKNPRVESVGAVNVGAIAGGLKFSVIVIPRGETQRHRPLTIAAELR